MSKIYVASSWRNEYHGTVVKALEVCGHEVYDFKAPTSGFNWKQIDPNWESWTPQEYIEHLYHTPLAGEGYTSDKNTLDWCDTCVIVLPCGRSAHLEAGYCIGQGKKTFFLIYLEKFEPELMYLLGDGCYTDLESLLWRLNQ